LPLAVVLVFLSGCAAKNFAAIPMTQPGDDALSCPEIKQQIDGNTAQEEVFLRKDKGVEQENVAKNVGGVLPGIGLVLIGSTNLSNEEQVEARSLVDRNERLSYLSKSRECPQ
jgi:hypothetical protein